MKKDLSKSEAKKKISEFFSEVKSKSPKELKKIKRLSMKNRLSLKEYKPLFCKKCFTSYTSPKIRIKNKVKVTECEKCGHKSRKRLEKSV